MKKVFYLLALSIFVFLTALFNSEQVHALSFPLDTADIGISSSVNPQSISIGSEVVITVLVGNVGSVEKTIETITNTLPEGFVYIDGSTTGATTENPSINDRKLIYKGPFQIAADGGTITISFRAHASSVPGTYTNKTSVRERDNSKEIGQPIEIIVVQSVTSLLPTVSNSFQEPPVQMEGKEFTVERLIQGSRNQFINAVLSSILFMIAFAGISAIVWFFLPKNVLWNLKQRIGKKHIIVLLVLVYLGAFWFITSNNIVSGPFIIEYNWF